MKITNLQKEYPNFKLSIDEWATPANSITGLVGGNGCGKSTLLAIMAGILPPDGGRVDYAGLNPRDITLVPRKPYMMQDTVYRNLVYPLQIRGRKSDTAQVEYYINAIGFAGREDQQAVNLSSGEQQKLALARALIFEPKLILLDEAFTNLDIESRILFEQLVLETQAKKPVTWVVVSHQLSHIGRLCNNLVFMHNGKIREQGATVERLRAPQTEELKQYLQNETLPELG